MNVRRWDRIVAAWAAGDDRELDDAWVDLGSQWGRTSTSPTFAA
jgi:hypothetical protein